ncbi:sodium ion-translocating decarboxylase subunit beta [Salmonella enterica subsp. enterica serovar Senftenberg]|nr:sodium ion-translocating decarboxylase subunit beta [Salmonella enterica subsp. enterica serovar Senftenberg]
MLLVSLLLLWLAIAKKFEPLLLLPIGFGGLLQHPGSGHGADRAGKPAGASRRRAAGGDCREA